jgi:hypothetical protein
VSVYGRSAVPGTRVPVSGSIACWTLSGRDVSFDSSKPDSWQPARAHRRARAMRGRARTAGITSDSARSRSRTGVRRVRRSWRCSRRDSGLLTASPDPCGGSAPHSCLGPPRHSHSGSGCSPGGHQDRDRLGIPDEHPEQDAEGPSRTAAGIRQPSRHGGSARRWPFRGGLRSTFLLTLPLAALSPVRAPQQQRPADEVFRSQPPDRRPVGVQPQAHRSRAA